MRLNEVTTYPYDQWLCRFEPLRTDDLQNDAGRWVGLIAIFEHLWVMDDDDPFPGQAAFRVADYDHPAGAMGWVPAQDLVVRGAGLARRCVEYPLPGSAA